MTDDDAWTCGKGLAAGADLPGKLAILLAARGDVLERHTRALDPEEPAGGAELEVYLELARLHREVATRLEHLAGRMAACHDLPMAGHDMEVMSDPAGQLEAFRRFVAAERDLLDLLRASVEAHQAMLGDGSS